jgi:hypothetical protein
MKTCGSRVPPFFNSALDVSDWSATRSGRFTLGERARGAPLDMRLGGPQSHSGRCEEENNLLPLPGIESRSSSL